MTREDEIPQVPDGTPPPPTEAPRVTAAEAEAADELTRLAQEMGTYGQPHPDARPRRDDDYTPEAINRDQADDLDAT